MSIDPKRRSNPPVPPAASALTWRTEMTVADLEGIRVLTREAGNFTTEEVDLAVELVDARLQFGAASGYQFLLAEQSDQVLAGYACFGPISATQQRYDLYWIAVAPAWQRRRLGSDLLHRVEQTMWDQGAQRIYIETSTLDSYSPAREFYVRSGYIDPIVVPDFYRDGDGKLIMVKIRPLRTTSGC
ncbi:MAG: GNAT family N-acetyltransferase [Magnetococcales bacterium]|nr:GNAT family N-acetyltransferase [Magnetococcales bacterium]